MNPILLHGQTLEDIALRLGYNRPDEAVNLFAWHEVENYGDRLGPALFSALVRRPVHIEARNLVPTLPYGAPRSVHCFLGTMAHLVEGQHRFVFYGFGAAPPDGPSHHGCRPCRPGLDIDFRAVRGKLTAQVFREAGYSVGDVPLGDPGLLVPALLEPADHRIGDVAFVPHHTQYRAWRRRFPWATVVDLTCESYLGLPRCVTDITRFSLVITSSLHAAVTAEAYGVPVIVMDPVLPFKFADFYSAAAQKTMKGISSNEVQSLEWIQDMAATWVREWTPYQWDAARWLERTPFPIAAATVAAIDDHFKALADQAKPTPHPQHSKVSRPGQSSTYAPPDEALPAVLYSRSESGGAVLPGFTIVGSAPHLPGTDDHPDILVRAPGEPAYFATPFTKIETTGLQSLQYEATGERALVEVLLQTTDFETRESRLHAYEPTVAGRFFIAPLDVPVKVRIVFIVRSGMLRLERLLLHVHSAQTGSTVGNSRTALVI